MNGVWKVSRSDGAVLPTKTMRFFQFIVGDLAAQKIVEAPCWEAARLVKRQHLLIARGIELAVAAGMGVEPSEFPLVALDCFAQGFPVLVSSSRSGRATWLSALTANMHEVATQAAVWVDDKVIKGLTLEWQRWWWRDPISQAEDANQLGVA